MAWLLELNLMSVWGIFLFLCRVFSIAQPDCLKVYFTKPSRSMVNPSDIATVEPGQDARIALTAYDAARYGYLYGSVIKVSPDTVFRDETKDYSYTVTIDINETIYEDDGSAVEIVPGMMSQVDIIRGSRTILEYMWQPFAKVKDTAFRE